MGLEPVDSNRHFESLFEAASDDVSMWEFLPHGPFENRDGFRTWLEWASDSTGHLFFIVIDRRTRHAEGMLSYMRVVPPHGVIEIGYIWFGKRLRRSTHIVVKGRNRDTACYTMLDRELQSLRTVFDAWLSQENFDKAGEQRQSLSAERRD